MKNLYSIQTPLSEYTKFLSSTYYEEICLNVSRRLGYKKTLASIAIEIMWEECKFRQDYHLQKLSPWCAVCCYVSNMWCHTWCVASSKIYYRKLYINTKNRTVIICNASITRQ